METESSVYQQTYQKYLHDLEAIDLARACQTLDLEYRDGKAHITFVGRQYMVSPRGVADSRGKQPNLGICVALSRYLLMCPPFPPKDGDWTTFRDIKGAGPLTVFWANEVEKALAQAFAGRPRDLKKAGEALDAVKPDQDYSYDVEFQVMALSRMPMLVLFNDGDEDFAPKSTVLFRQSAGTYLDPESLAILGVAVAQSLVRE
ncbi:MAG: DUF3786 domain-containing protein [Desulfatibacillum sp.]|nr:DUF3786 domain-containing protein [Desulfatibacillum sp.]